VSVEYPIFVFEKDDHSMRLIENEDRILHHLEAIDIENGEYAFWDANRAGMRISVSVGTFKSKLENVSWCAAAFPIQNAFKLLAASLGVREPQGDEAPMTVWKQIQQGREDSERTTHRATD
jgi:hypothetical protein